MTPPPIPYGSASNLPLGNLDIVKLYSMVYSNYIEWLGIHQRQRGVLRSKTKRM